MVSAEIIKAYEHLKMAHSRLNEVLQMDGEHAHKAVIANTLSNVIQAENILLELREAAIKDELMKDIGSTAYLVSRF